MRLALSIRSLRTAVLGAVLSLGALAGLARDAAAQGVRASAAYACGGSPCSTVRFTLVNDGPALLQLVSLRLSSVNPTFAFAAPLGPNAGTFGAVDDLNPDGFGGLTRIVGSGSDLFIDDFTEGAIFPPFTLAVGRSGFVDVQLTATPVLQNGVFFVSGELPGDQRLPNVAVSVAAASTVPEPSTYVLLATGLGTLGMLARRRRVA